MLDPHHIRSSLYMYIQWYIHCCYDTESHAVNLVITSLLFFLFLKISKSPTLFWIIVVLIFAVTFSIFIFIIFVCWNPTPIMFPFEPPVLRYEYSWYTSMLAPLPPSFSLAENCFKRFGNTSALHRHKENWHLTWDIKLEERKQHNNKKVFHWKRKTLNINLHQTLHTAFVAKKSL